MSELEIKVDDKNFSLEVLESPLPVLVDFFATWCGPCRMIAPAVEEIAREYQGRLKVCTVDIDGAPDSASRYGVLSVPTLILFKGGAEMDRIVGAVPRAAIEKMIKTHC
ncbi:MAG: thioredoxin [Candidatus Aureabacteria bacterium]|nr:thioredoxin [Candidatus Auribacterota bacterium]